jgi:hypothetical protein
MGADKIYRVSVRFLEIGPDFKEPCRDNSRPDSRSEDVVGIGQRDN